MTRAQQGQGPVTAEALEFAEYFLLWTTLSEAFPTRAVLDLYRRRWQIELVFKRMKSILGLGHLPKKDRLPPTGNSGQVSLQPAHRTETASVP